MDTAGANREKVAGGQGLVSTTIFRGLRSFDCHEWQGRGSLLTSHPRLGAEACRHCP